MKKVVMLVLVAAFCFAQPVFAEDYVGKWKTIEDWGTRTGDGDHGFKEGDSWVHKKSGSFTLTIEEVCPEGRSVHGPWCSAKRCEDVVGFIRSNGDLLMVDEEGYFMGTFAEGMLELCYLEASKKFRVASCRKMKR